MPKPPPPPNLVEIFPDLPVRGAEGLAFEFEGLARTLAEIAWNPSNRTPLTVVVRGDWGRGKTTLMRQTQRLFESQTDVPQGARVVKTVWFNAWKYPTENTVLAGLLGAMLREMRTGNLGDQPWPRTPAAATWKRNSGTSRTEPSSPSSWTTWTDAARSACSRCSKRSTCFSIFPACVSTWDWTGRG